MTSTVSLLYGIGFLLAALSGFVWLSPIHPGAPPLIVDSGYGLALGLLPVNILHNLVHLLFGILGIAASRGIGLSSRGYLQVVAVAYGLLVVLGLIPLTNTTFGLIPIYGNDVWLHLVLAVPAAYFGFMAPAGVPVRR